MLNSARAAHQAATHEESRAEDRHDTFAIEASYLAAGQAVRVQELKNTLLELEGYLTHSPSGDQVAPGCLVTYQSEDGKHQVLMTRLGGGAKANVQGSPFQILSSTSPLGKELLGLRAGEEVEVEVRGTPKPFKILAIE